MIEDFSHENSANRALSSSDKRRIENAIAKAEITTSGEIRVFMEMLCPQEDARERAFEVFQIMEMEKTQLRNGVLIYLALKSRKVAIVGDKGIDEKSGGKKYWDEELTKLVQFLQHNEIIEGLEYTIAKIGFALGKHFPYQPGEDINELPNKIAFDLPQFKRKN